MVVAVLVAATTMLFDLTVVTGASMEPGLYRGDLVFSVPWRDPLVGDMIVFDAGGGNMVVHRIVRVLPDGTLATKGDANRYVDLDAVDPRRVRGVVVVLLPLGRLSSR